MIKVLIVDDSAVTRQHLSHILSADADIQVLPAARDGEEAVKLAVELKPNVITMDIVMPRLDGIEATRKIMQTCPTPIIIVSANWTAEETEMTFRAMEAGAVTLIEKPVSVGHPRYEALAQELRQTVRLMSEVKVVRRWLPRSKVKPPEPPRLEAVDVDLVAIGVSTGGPPVLHTILSSLPPDFSVPILVVQHIAAGFLPGLVDWLRLDSALPIHVAQHREMLVPGHVYFAPDDQHMGVNWNRQIMLNNTPKENNLRPAVSYLFRSALENFGSRVMGILLTGMGRDGAAELRQMMDCGAVTIAQNKETCVVFGMPGEAVALGGAKFVLPPNKIVDTMVRLTSRS